MNDRDPVIVSSEILTAYGKGADVFWNGLLEGRHALTPLKRFNTVKSSTSYAGTISENLISPSHSITKQMIDYLAPYALPFPEESTVFLASTLGEIEHLENPEGRCTSNSLLEKALLRFRKKHGVVVSAACASSNIAIARAGEMIRKGKLDYAIIIGCDYVSEFIFSGFATLKAMAQTISYPYDRDRNGLILGDSAGIVVMTSAKNAKENNLKIRAKVSGWAVTCDAVHITAPMPSGEKLAKAIQKAVEMAGIDRHDIGAVIGHGTGTKYNDGMEINALNSIYPDAPKPLFSVKGACGHTLACAGLIQTAAAIKMFETGLIPPQTSLRTPEPGAEKMLSKEVRKLKIPRIVSMNSGFGGVNAVVILEGAK